MQKQKIQKADDSRIQCHDFCQQYLSLAPSPARSARRIFVKTSCARSQGPASATNEWHTWPNSEGTLRVLVILVDLVTTQASSRFSCLMTSCLCTMSSRLQVLTRNWHKSTTWNACTISASRLTNWKTMKSLWNNVNRLTTKNSGSGFHEIHHLASKPKHVLNCVLSSFLTSQNPLALRLRRNMLSLLDAWPCSLAARSGRQHALQGCQAKKGRSWPQMRRTLQELEQVMMPQIGALQLEYTTETSNIKVYNGNTVYMYIDTLYGLRID